MTTKRREYTREFKLEAISLVVDHNRKVVVVQKVGWEKNRLRN